MKTKHTPGVWVSSAYRVDVDVADGLSGICEMSDWMDESEMEANAKLIAAAPELLEACINSFKTFHSIGCTMEAEIMQELESAIKKATE